MIINRQLNRWYVGAVAGMVSYVDGAVLAGVGRPPKLRHDGAGGQTGMADAKLKIGLGYTRNRLSWVDPTLSLVPVTR